MDASTPDSDAETPPDSAPEPDRTTPISRGLPVPDDVKSMRARPWVASLLDHLPAGIALIDEFGFIRDLSREGAELLGVKRREMIGQHVLATVPDGLRDVAMEAFDALVRSDVLQDAVWPMNQGFGGIRSLRLRHRGWTAPDGSRWVLAVAMHEQENVDRAAELLRSTEVIERLLEQLPGTIARLDPADIVRWMRPSGGVAAAMNLDQRVIHQLSDLVPADILEILPPSVRDGQQSFRFRARDDDPDTLLEGWFFPMTSGESTLQLRLVHRKAGRYRRELQEAMDLLYAGLAHEIRNPLALARTSLGYLERRLDIPADPDLAEAFDDIRDALRQVADVLQHMRTVHHGVASPGITDLREVVERSLRVARVGFPDGVVVHHEPGPPAPVHGPRQPLVQVLVNLLTNAGNALRRVPENARCIRIELRRDADWQVLRLSDTGNGLAPEQLRHLFTGGSSSRVTEESSGLGLFLSRQIVESFGGDLAFEGPSRSGTTVSLRLRVADDDRKGETDTGTGSS